MPSHMGLVAEFEVLGNLIFSLQELRLFLPRELQHPFGRAATSFCTTLSVLSCVGARKWFSGVVPPRVHTPP
jgi:hypothetical protein